MHVWSISFDLFELFSLEILKVIVAEDATLWLAHRLARLLDLLSYWLFNHFLNRWNLIGDLIFFIISSLFFAVGEIVLSQVDILFNWFSDFPFVLFLIEFLEISHLLWLANTLACRALYEFFMKTHFNCWLHFLNAVVDMHCFLSYLNRFFNDFLDIVNHFLSLRIT